MEEKGYLDSEMASAIFEKSNTLGLYAMNVPSEFGGAGLSALETMMVEEHFGHTIDILARRAFRNVYEVHFGCDEAQRDRWLYPCVSGDRTVSIAITEPEAGSDARAITTKAQKDGSGWLLNGRKHLISDGLFSDFFVVSAVTDLSTGGRSISLFLVDKESPGVVAARDQNMMGLKGTSHVELFFDDVHLDADSLIGELESGMRQIRTTLGRVCLAQVGARSVGKSAQIMDLAVDYARTRKRFGKSIGEFQMIQSMIALDTMKLGSGLYDTTSSGGWS